MHLLTLFECRKEFLFLLIHNLNIFIYIYKFRLFNLKEVESFDPSEIGERFHKEIVHSHWSSFQLAISRIRWYVTYSDIAPE